ncbi:uncharacterized protein LOC105228533 [Bactrocera dorsalis]|uniref:Uncharacterized protein LOC105228533 n=1 Tax=Bactrocera dorsalis TaxID=27457 RepID=A0ABM3J737_BACDO|nr:uncharacterized protein LOC105228533 [Bactrocera dorsalis]XP_049305045.1 uncharacterized protein LOC105228533 [Bactrocera dorsalis]XP_049305046.1 uncharacterized protein LOC105228533 [Bactrocera dorsalis]XP_049305047.1 uncharacterized protein LOC105228533 [Bactrocera dorsalis]
MMDVKTAAAKHSNNMDSVANGNAEMLLAHDEVDFIAVAAHNNNNNSIFDNKTMSNGLHSNSNTTSTIFTNSKTSANEHLQYQQQQQHKEIAKSKKKVVTNEEPKKKSSPKERISLFSTLGRRFSQKTLKQKDSNANESSTAHEKSTATATPSTTITNTVAKNAATNNNTPHRQRTFVKSSSIVRLLGNTYQQHAKKLEKPQLNLEKGKTPLDGKFHTYGGRRRTNGPYLDRFKRYSKDDGDVTSNKNNNEEDAEQAMDFTDVLELEADTADELQRASSGLERFCDHSTVAAGDDEAAAELGSKTMRTLSRSLGRLWGKRLHSVDISTPDPEYKVSYLGNVLTGWAKGEGCVEKQLNTLWRNYTQNNKPDMIMRIKVCASGLKATTRQHGLTEYWANRITHCCAPKNYPRIFCWVYRHEGRKLKHELRCHAVLCSKEKVVQDICNTLKENLERALREFKREKILKQNARLSLANAAYENPSLPRRKILLSVGGNNYRPPLERSKSAPKLMAIEEAIGEEEGEDAEDTNEPEMKPCCQKDSLYPAMTLGRRRCRRGHSIRRTGKPRLLCGVSFDESQKLKHILAGDMKVDTCCHDKQITKECASQQQATAPTTGLTEEQRNSYGSDDSDDFEKLLKYNDYDANTSLATELLPYFDMQLHKNTSSSLSDLCALKDDEEPLSLLPTINNDPMAHPEGDLLPSDCAQGTNGELEEEESHVGLRRNGVCSDGEEDYLDADDMYFRQSRILNILHRNSMRKMAQISLSSDEGSSLETNASAPLQYRHQTQSSISSNASSNATTSSSLQDGHNGSSTGKRHSGADSDEGSISSGCETASIVTANQDDLSLQYRHDKQLLQLQQQQQSALQYSDEAHFFNMPDTNESPITADEIYQRLEARLQRRQNSDATTFSSSSTITLKMSAGSDGSSPQSPNEPVTQQSASEQPANALTNSTTRVRRQRQRQMVAATPPPPDCNADDTDSECSDESGYVEYQEREKTVREKIGDVERRQLQQQQLQEQQQHQPIAQKRQLKPQLPPKPLPRRTLSGASAGALAGAQRTSSSTTV